MKKFHPKNLLLAASLVMGMAACEKDDQVNIDLPAYQIAKSETLIMPDAVKLPLNAPKGNTRVLTLFAVGVQKYKAVAKGGSDPVVLEWAFVAPQAELYDKHNNKVGTHTAGPTWQLSANDSIYAQHFSPPQTSPSPDGNTNIDWLLLKTKEGKTATGVFAEVDYIQRIVTKGGKAPSAPPSFLGATADVHYTAIYRFSKINQ